MAITRLKRKGRRNKLKSKIRAQKFKLEGFSPVLKNIDVEAVKEEFKAAVKAVPAKKEGKVEAKVVEPEVTTTKAEKAQDTKDTKPATSAAKAEKKAEPVKEKKKAAPVAKVAKAKKEEKAPVVKEKAPAKKKAASKAKKSE